MKGAKGETCNRTACQQEGAVYYNKSTMAYYCRPCADQINWPGGRAEVLALYGTEFLCEIDPEAVTIHKARLTAILEMD
jgi:hypothetical protein